MRLEPYLDQYETWAKEYLAKLGLMPEDIEIGTDAWSVAHRCGIYRHALSTSSDIVDAHVQTALKRVFPRAVFRDKAVY